MQQGDHSQGEEIWLLLGSSLLQVPAHTGSIFLSRGKGDGKMNLNLGFSRDKKNLCNPKTPKKRSLCVAIRKTETSTDNEEFNLQPYKKLELM